MSLRHRLCSTRVGPAAPAASVALVAALVAALVVSLVFGSATAGASGARTMPAPSPATKPGRMLIVSLPGVTWADVEGHDLPNLERFASKAALADLAPRGVRTLSGPGDAYLTISGGSRAATKRHIDGQVLGVEERSAGSRAGDIFTRRTGVAPDGPYVSLTWPSLVKANDRQPFDTKLGSLTDALQAAGVSASVIGNADGVDSISESYERQVGLALADGNGVVPDGSLGKDLLEEESSQPFGVRLDDAVVAQRFEDAWDAAAPTSGSKDSRGGVVLVEASDLARTLRYRPTVDADRYEEMWSEALEQSDSLLGQLLESVDPATDTVLVVAPYNGPRERDLTMVALRGPATRPGYLRSASTQRSGFLTLVDIGPTVLDTFGIARPVEMEGRPAVSDPSAASGPARIAHLVTLNEASRFRENLLTPTTTLIVLLMAAVLALTIAAHANRWSRRARVAIAFLAAVDLAFLPASYLARLFELERHGAGFYWMFLLAAALASTALATLVGVRLGAGRAALVTALTAMAGVLIVDVVTGSHLSLSAAFGYSATGNSRLYGISNYSYGQLAAATCLLAAWLAEVRPGRTGQLLGLGTMLVTLVVLGVPIWGSDVGGVLAFTPAVVAFGVSITGRRIRARAVLLGGLGTAVAIGIFGTLDLARAPDNRGHLGRLFERIGAEGPSPVVSMIQRKLLANLEVSTTSLWVLAIPVGIAFWVFLRRFPDQPRAQVHASFPSLSAGLTAALVAGVLGSALNDSGAIIGGVMTMVVATSVAILVLQGDPPPSPQVRGEAEPER